MYTPKPYSTYEGPYITGCSDSESLRCREWIPLCIFAEVKNPSRLNVPNIGSKVEYGVFFEKGGEGGIYAIILVALPEDSAPFRSSDPVVGFCPGPGRHEHAQQLGRDAIGNREGARFPFPLPQA